MMKQACPPHRTVLLALVLGLAAAGCGHHHDDGLILVDNRTDLTTNEALVAFRVAPFGLPFSGDLLGGDLPPRGTRLLGRFGEAFYDAEADLELGQLVEWFDIFVGHDETTVFEAR